MKTRFALTGAQVFDGRDLHDGIAVVVAGGQIEAVLPEDQLPAGVTRVALDGGILCPGFVDLQVNGGGGVLFNDAPEVAVLERMARAHAGLGATTILPTLISDVPDRTRAAIDAVALAVAQGVPGIGGLHLEGPHLALSRKGAHEPGCIRVMQAADLELLLEAAKRLPVLIVTLAPEAVSLEQIAALAQAGVVVSLGHSDCSCEQARAAFGAGARMVTHLFNAMSQLGSRAPGLVGAALSEQGIAAGVIADLVHVQGPALQVALAADAMRAGLFLVSDAMAPAGSDLASFTLTGQRVTRAGGTLRLNDGTLAGADLDLARAVRNLLGLGVPVAQALAMATIRPARAAGLGHAGFLCAGADADLVHMNERLELKAVWQKGQAVALSPS
ncbi:N-acetylglucosamine-6-phosphate deacetylase [Puniceibacterium sediminis]|uniref:N-acetylglucosamine 6-phosphate deacetylase n=1 Tax=Puniceibacterium sediminis TaxID=1608407 RepID=A0A238VIV1_9RHOB|nr:N-acetylglucosamine-6-phosphate deacetylase [Puniceibacterium sediminis]SNR33439.1 N-acetylglucosamine 6-phosphate deacetylase [Puniceibacterium sediminis]